MSTPVDVTVLLNYPVYIHLLIECVMSIQQETLFIPSFSCHFSAYINVESEELLEEIAGWAYFQWIGESNIIRIFTLVCFSVWHCNACCGSTQH